MCAQFNNPLTPSLYIYIYIYTSIQTINNSTTRCEIFVQSIKPIVTNRAPSQRLVCGLGRGLGIGEAAGGKGRGGRNHGIRDKFGEEKVTENVKGWLVLVAACGYQDSRHMDPSLPSLPSTDASLQVALLSSTSHACMHSLMCFTRLRRFHPRKTLRVAHFAHSSVVKWFSS